MMRVLAGAVVLSTVVSSLAAAAAPSPDSTTKVLPGLDVRARRPVWGSPTTLDRSWLEQRDPVDLAHALQFVPGIQLKQTTAGTSLSFRGLGAERVAVLWDGRPLNAEQGGGVDLWSLNLEAVERVDVTRGSAGAVYGPHALSGAVNLVPKRGFGNSLSMRVLGGTGGRLRAAGAGGTTAGAWDARVSGFTETRDTQRLNLPSAYSGWGGTVEVGRTGAVTGVTFTASAGSDDRDIPGTLEFPTPAARLANRRFLAAGRADWLAGNSDVSLDLSWLQRNREYRDPGNPFGPVDDSHRNQRLAGTAAWESGRWRVFTDGAIDQLESSTDGGQDRNRAAAGVESEFNPAGLRVNTAFRWDAVEHFSPEPTWRLAASRDVAGSLEARLSGGTSFRAPTFDDLFWPARATAAGNPDLQPEYAWDLEAGLSRRGPVSFDFAMFYSRYTDMIIWSPGAGGIWRPYNVGRARVAGAELSSRAEFQFLNLPTDVNAAFTWLDARNINGNPLTDGTRLPGRPPLRLMLEGAVSPGAWRFGAGTEIVGAIPLTPGETKTQDGYALLNLQARRRLSANLWIDLEGRNLTDAYYEDIRGYPTPGRELLLGLRFRSRETP